MVLISPCSVHLFLSVCPIPILTCALFIHCPLASPAMSKAGSALVAIALRRDQRLAPGSARRSCCTVCIPLVTVARTYTRNMPPLH